MEQLRYKDKIAGQVLRFWKEDKMARLLLKIRIHPKGRPGLNLLESCGLGLFGYSFKVQQTSHSLFLNQSAVFQDPNGSQGCK